MNQLQYEKSPYLLQHRENPVNWYAWKAEAFEKAKQEDKPIFLSIGYSTCHWCHVMAHESFESEEVAEILNRGFVSVKVDREERPDVDAVYMGVCQMMTGSGGWPLTIIMTPEQKPFFAGTYFPKWSRYGMPGLLELLENIERLWKTERKKLLEAGERITAILQQETESHHAEPKIELLRQGAKQLLQRFDEDWGGFGSAPKFPTPHNLLFLLRYSTAEKDKNILSAVKKTLDCMAQGGIFDHIGGGFSRYSTDEKWLVPHFEKMLYDNALLAYTYLKAYRQTGKNFYRIIAEKTLDYVLRELTDEEGAFCCGQDADSEGVEGKYYVFTPKEIEMILQEDAKTFCQWFHITEKGNFDGKSIPNRLRETPFAEQNEKIKRLCETVYDYRKERTSLHRDDKILTAWNGLMIAALARAGIDCENKKYLDAAKKAAAFIEKKLMDESGRLYLRYRDGEAAHLGQLDDYAFFVFGLLELYEATFEVSYLEKAIHLAGQMRKLFADEKGGLFLYAEDAERLIQRPKEMVDGAMPSGNSVAGYVFAKLAALTGEKEWQEIRDYQLAFLVGEMEEMPSAHCFGLYTICEVLYPSVELICVSAEDRPSAEFLLFVKEKKTFGMTALFKNSGNEKQLAEMAPFTAEYPIPEQGEVYYYCRGRSCFAPQKDLAGLEKILQENV